MGLLGAAAFLPVGGSKLLAGNAAAQSAGLKSQAYLQNPSPTAMTIAWVSLSASANWVEYGETSSLGMKAFASAFGMAVVNNTTNKIRIENLKPGTTYYYRVCTREIIRYEAGNVEFGMNFNSSVFDFTTPPLGQNDVTALVFNDIHQNVNTIKTLLNYHKDPFDMVFLNGDIISEFEKQDQAVNFVINPCSAAFAKKTPFYFVRGNHETRGEHSFNFFDYFENPGDQTYYAFTRGPVFFIVLDSGEDKEDSHEVAYGGLAFFDEFRIEQSTWLEKQLRSEERKAALYTVVLMHIPSHHSGTWHGPTHVASRFGPLFNQYGISILISGHTHTYQYCAQCAGHNYPIMIGGAPEAGKRTMIKIAAGQEKMQVVMYSDSGIILNQMSVQAPVV